MRQGHDFPDVTAQTPPVQREGPQPLLREIAAGACYPVEALGPLREAVEAAQAITQAPTAIAAQSALSVVSLAVQSHADVETLGGTAPLSLFCLTVAKSGERKSATDGLLMAALRGFERDRAAEIGDAIDLHKNTHALWKGERDKILAEAKAGKGDKRTQAEADLRAMGPEPEPPLSTSLTATEPTLEGLHRLFAIGQPALGLFSDEGGQFLGGHAMNSENRLKTIAGLSALWGGEPINRTRAGDGASTLYGRRLAVHLLVQPIAARPLLADPVATGQGFLARFLITEPPSAIGTRFLTVKKGANSTALDAYGARLVQLLEAEKPSAEHSAQELEPRRLPLSDAARGILIDYYNAVEAEQGHGGAYEQITAFASKSAEQAARLAGVLSLWGNLDAVEVTADAMQNGVTLAEFYLGEAKRLAEAATISADIEKAERLRLWILESWPDRADALSRDPATLLPSDVVQHGPGNLRETREAKRYLTILAEAGWVIALHSGSVVDGKARKLAYQIVRPSHDP